MKIDVLIVGGGPSGLSAALILGRCRRQVLLCDDNKQRNRASHAIHGLLGREGTSPGEFLEEARRDLARYETVALKVTRVTDIRREGEGFAFGCSDGSTGSASKILLATGLVDELPELPGMDNLYGVSVHHCLYCDGFEYAGKGVAAYAKGDKGTDLAIMMKHWTPDVVALTDGTEVSADATLKLRQHDIKLRREPVRSLEGANGQLKTIRFVSGPDLGKGSSSRQDAARALSCRSVLAANVVRKAGLSSTLSPKKPASPASMSQETCRATFCSLRSPLLRAQKQRSQSTKPS